MVSPTGPCAVSGGGWQPVSIPLDDVFDDNSFHFAGNGVFDPGRRGEGTRAFRNVNAAVLCRLNAAACT